MRTTTWLRSLPSHLAGQRSGSPRQWPTWPSMAVPLHVRHSSSKMKTLGLLGGMSWKTTAFYYAEVNKRVASRRGGLHSADLLIKSLDYADVAAAVQSGEPKKLFSLLCQGGSELKAAGAKALVLCANVAHKAADSLEDELELPVLHIVDFTARSVLEGGHRRVGLLGTEAVMEENFYRSRLEKYGLEVCTPTNAAFRAAADDSIFNELSKEVIPGSARAAWYNASRELINEQKVDCLILACTELRLVLHQQNLSVPLFETTTIHAHGIVDWALDAAG